MTTIGFFTPVKYNCTPLSFDEKLLEKVENYLYLGGKKAYVIRNQAGRKEAVISEGRISKSELALKLISIVIPLFPLIALMMKAVLRARHSFYKIDVKAELERGINVESTARKVQGLIGKILNRDKDDEIQVINPGNNFVFGLKSEPNLVLKIPSDQGAVYVDGNPIKGNELMNHRFKGMIKAEEVCLAHQLDLLKVPRAKKFDVEHEGKRYTLIAEEKLEIDINEQLQEDHFKQGGRALNKTIKQVTTFIAKTKFSDVTWRNIPLMKPLTSRKIALIDLEEMMDARMGILGLEDGRRRGIIGCVNEEQMDLVINQARDEGVKLFEYEVRSVKRRRRVEIEEQKKIAEFHRKSPFKDSDEIDTELDSLGLDLDQEYTVKRLKNGVDEKFTVTLEEIANDVISDMNFALQLRKHHPLIKDKRFLQLTLHSEKLECYDQEAIKSILEAMVAKKCIYSYSIKAPIISIQA